MPRDGSKNLKPVISKEQARELGRRGGIKSGQVRRENKAFKELAEIVLSLDAPKDSKKLLLKSFPKLKGKHMTAKLAAMTQLCLKAAKGDLQAFLALRDTIGEKPNDVSDTNLNIKVDWDDDSKKKGK